MGTRFKFVVKASHSRGLAAIAFLTLAACGDGGSTGAAPTFTTPPRLSLERIQGMYVGSVLTESGVKAVVLEIREIAADRLSFRYRMTMADVIEDGLGFMRPEGMTTRVCFERQVCGWLIDENGFVRIDAEAGPNDAFPAWTLRKK